MLSECKYSMSERADIYSMCAEVHGLESQYLIAIEEYSELLAILARYWRYDVDDKHLITDVMGGYQSLPSEIADVYIVTESIMRRWADELTSGVYHVEQFYTMIAQKEEGLEKKASRDHKTGELREIIRDMILALSRGISAASSSINGYPATVRKADIIAGINYHLDLLVGAIDFILHGNESFQADIIEYADRKLDRLVKRLRKVNNEST